jgi:hypothetical protein
MKRKLTRFYVNLGYLNDIPCVHSAGRIISGESGDSRLNAIVVTRNGVFFLAILSAVNQVDF